MNTKVTATGMQVKAKADQVFLQIVNSTTQFSDTTAQNTAATTNEVKEIGASNVVKTFDATNPVAYDGSTIVWVANHSIDPSSSVAAGSYTNVTTQATATDETNTYTQINTFKVRLNPTTGVTKAAGNLRVTDVKFDATTLALTTDPMRNAVSVLVVCGEKSQLFKQENPAEAGTMGDGTFTEVGTNFLTAAEFEDSTTTGTTVTVYVFIDGSNNSAYKNNVKTSGYTVDLTFSVEAVEE